MLLLVVSKALLAPTNQAVSCEQYWLVDRPNN